MINAKKIVQENVRKEDLVANAKLLEAFIVEELFLLLELCMCLSF